MADDMTDVRNALKNNTIIIGKDNVMKEMKKGGLLKVFLASNVSDKMEKDMSKYAKLAEVPVAKLSLPSDELKVVCKKQFLVSILGIRK
jgi:ribosomal protein L30E